MPAPKASMPAVTVTEEFVWISPTTPTAIP